MVNTTQTKRLAQLFDQETYLKYSKYILRSILNSEYKGSLIRIPQISQYVNFKTFNYDDYKLLDSYDERERQDKVLYYYSNISLSYFHEFTKEQGRVSERKVNPFTSTSNIPGDLEDIGQFIPLETAVFTSLIKASRALKEQIMGRFMYCTDNNKLGVYKKVFIDVQFFYPSQSYYNTAHHLKVVLAVTLKKF